MEHIELTIDELATYLATNLNACITARSTEAVPLASISSDQIVTREYQLPAKKVGIFLDPGEETIEPLTMATVDVRLPVEIIVFTQGDTVALMRAKADGYMLAILDCIGDHPDFFEIERRDRFDGVEGKEDIKAAKIVAVFRYEEAR
jgi:hypothetical protein